MPEGAGSSEGEWRQENVQLSLRHSPLLGAEETFGKAVWLLCPSAWTKLSFCPDAESASSSFAENVLPCEISCPRHAVGTGSLWVRAAAWAPLCLAHLGSVRGAGAQLMLPSQSDSRIGTSWGSDGFSVYFGKSGFNHTLSRCFCTEPSGHLWAQTSQVLHCL